MSLLHGLDRNTAGALRVTTDSAKLFGPSGIPVGSKNLMRVALAGGSKVIRGVLYTADDAVVIARTAPATVEKGVGYLASRAICVTDTAPAATAKRVFLPDFGYVLADTSGYIHIEEYDTMILSQSAVAASGAADTNENALATITVPAGTIGPNGSLRILASFTFTNSANNKTLRVRLGGVSGTVFYSLVATTTVSAQTLTVISNRNDAASQYGFGAAASPQFGSVGSGEAGVTATVNTAAATTVVISGQKALGTETITLERYSVEVLYGA